MSRPLFLNRSQIEFLHKRGIDQYGGASGLRDEGLFESAINQPESDWFYGNADLFGISAAYAYHLAQNQAFFDGNKRVGVAAGLVFLEVNGVDTDSGSEEIYDALIAVANDEMDKLGLADLLRSLFER